MFVIVVLACALGSLTQTAMNSMLGGIEDSFGTDDATSQWLTTIYMLGIGMTVPVVSHLSRRFDMRSMVLISLGFSLVGGIVAVFAPSFWVLLGARVLQSIGTGITLPLLQTIAMVRFPKGQNATAMGIAGIAMGFAPNIGPLIGGALVGTLGWRSFYWIFLGIVVLLLAACLVLLRGEQRPAMDGVLDMPSFILSIVGFGAILLGFSNASSMGINNPWVWIQIAVGAAGIAWFVIRQRRCAHPLISMKVFSSRTYAMSFVCQNLLFASFMGITLIVPLFVMNVTDMGPVEAGMVFLPATVLAVIFNPLAGIASDRIGYVPVIIFGAAVMSTGSVSMVFMGSDTPLWLIMTLQGIRGVGVSTLVGPLVSWGLSRLTPDVMVDGSAFFTAIRQACASFGTALMMACIVMVAGTSGLLGYQVALGLSAVFSLALLACVLISFFGFGDRPKEGEAEDIEKESGVLKETLTADIGDNMTADVGGKEGSRQ